MNITTQQLRYFAEVAKCLNFTRAAANLYVAQPTLSQQIAGLEAQIGTPLFIRNSCTVSLTPAGEILNNCYPDMVAYGKKIHRHMLNTAAGFSVSLRIGFLDVFMNVIPDIMKEFRKIYPDIAITPILGTRNELARGMKNHSFDVVFTVVQDFAVEDLAFCGSKLMERNPLCFVLPGDHPATSDYSFTENLPLITFDAYTDSYYCAYILSRLKKLGIHVSNIISTNSLGNLRAYIESGAGFSVLSKAQNSFFSENTQYIPIPDESLEFGFLWEACNPNPAMPLFLDFMEQYLHPGSQQG